MSFEQVDWREAAGAMDDSAPRPLLSGSSLSNNANEPLAFKGVVALYLSRLARKQVATSGVFPGIFFGPFRHE